MNATSWVAPTPIPAPPSAQKVDSKRWRPGRWWAMAAAIGGLACAVAYGFASPIHDALQHFFAFVAS